MKKIIIALLLFFSVFLLSGCFNKPTYNKPTYEDGYDDGYADGQLHPRYPEDITTEYVSANPDVYCDEYAREFCENHLEYLDTIYSCHEK